MVFLRRRHHPSWTRADPLFTSPTRFRSARFAAAGEHAAISALGCFSRGETRNVEHVADRLADGLLRVALDYRVPVANGVLALDEQQDAVPRAGGSHGNTRDECALVVREMASLLGKLTPAVNTAHLMQSPPPGVVAPAVACRRRQRAQTPGGNKWC